MKTYKIIPEHIIKESAEISKTFGDEENSFTKALDALEQYKEAGMTPMILLDSSMDLFVVTKETFGQKLH